MEKNKFQFWIYFGFLFTIFPIVIALLNVRGITSANFTWTSAFKIVISKGELLLICLSLLGSNFGDLIKNECENIKLKYFHYFCTFVLSIASINFYATLNTNTNNNIDIDYYFNNSIILFFCSVGICVASTFTKRKQ